MHLALEIAARAGVWVLGRTRKHRPGVSFSHIPLEITPRACSAGTRRSKFLLAHASKPLERSKSLLEKASSFDTIESTDPALLLDITARTYSAATGRSKARVGRASKPLTARNHCSSKLHDIRKHFRFSCGNPFEIALLRIVHCVELCLARLHKLGKVPYANMIY